MGNKEPVDIITDIMALTSFGNRKNVMLVAIEMRGRFDEYAFKLSANEGASLYPSYKSVLQEVHKGRTFYLTRIHNPNLEIPFFSGPLSTVSDAATTFEALISQLTPIFDRQWDLWNTPPLEIHVLNIAEDHRIVAFIAHHTGGDLAMALKVITEILGQYHTRATGEKPAWAKTPYVLSTARKKASSPKKSGWRIFWSQLKRDLSYRKRRPQKPHGTVNRNDPREWHVERVFSTEDTDRILKSFSRGGLHAVDHLVACTNISLDEWNRARQVTRGFVSSVVTVNMRERFGGAEEQNYSSAIFFNSTPEQRDDYPEFVRSVARARQRQLGRQLDLSLRKSIARGAKFFSLFPLSIRRRVARMFMELQHYSVAVGYLGVVWPDFKDENKRFDSSLKTLGHSEAVSIYGTGYKLAGNAYLNVYAFIYRRRLHIVLSSTATLLTKEECEGFVDLLLKTILVASNAH